MHTQSVQRDSSSGESFDFTALSDTEASDEGFDLYLARIAKKLKNQKVFRPSEPSRALEGDLHNVVSPKFRWTPDTTAGGKDDPQTVVISD